MANKVVASVKTTVHKQIDFADATNFLRRHQAMVGIPQETAGRNGQVSNAELMYIHTNGSPIKGIDARPVIEPAIEQPDVQKNIAEQLKQAALAALDGNKGGAKAGLEKAGLYGAKAAKDYFTSGNLKSLKDSTIRRRRNKSNTPLLDTGALRSSITHVVKEK